MGWQGTGAAPPRRPARCLAVETTCAALLGSECGDGRGAQLLFPRAPFLQKLLTVTGCINMSEAGKPGGCAPGALESAKMHGLEHTELTPAQAHERFPGYCPPDNFAVRCLVGRASLDSPPGLGMAGGPGMPPCAPAHQYTHKMLCWHLQVVYEPYGGVLCPEACIEAAIAAAIAAGAKLETGTAVSSWSVGPDGVVTVRTAAGKSYTGKKLILAAGAWMPVLVPELKASGATVSCLGGGFDGGGGEQLLLCVHVGGGVVGMWVLGC